MAGVRERCPDRVGAASPAKASDLFEQRRDAGLP